MSWLSDIRQKFKDWWNKSDEERDSYSGMIHIRDENSRVGFLKYKGRLPEFPLRGNSLHRDPAKTMAVRLKSDDPNEDRYFVRTSGHLGAPVMVVRFPKFKPLGSPMY